MSTSSSIETVSDVEVELLAMEVGVAGIAVGSGVSSGLVWDAVAASTVGGCCVGSNVDVAVDATNPDKFDPASC